MKERDERTGMNRRMFGGSLIGAASMVSMGVSLGQSHDGYEPLFDGKSLAGWHVNPQKIGHGTGGRWQIEEGAIVGEQDPPGSGNGGLLLSDRKFSDFDLLIDVNPDWGPCSGLFFRCTEGGEGFQMYVDYHDNGNVGHLRGEMKGAFALMPFKIFGQLDNEGKLTGLETKLDARREKWPEGVYKSICTMGDWLKAWKVGQWNTVRLRCEGKYPRVQTWVNDLPVCDFDGETCTLPWYDKEHVFGRLGGRGSIGLQVHGGKGWPTGTKCRWRNIRIKEI